MPLTNIELYEALKRDLNEEAARRIAEVVPAAHELATKLDIADLRTEMRALHTSTLRWMLGLFIPVWAATAGTLLAVVLKV